MMISSKKLLVCSIIILLSFACDSEACDPEDSVELKNSPQLASSLCNVLNLLKESRLRFKHDRNNFKNKHLETPDSTYALEDFKQLSKEITTSNLTHDMHHNIWCSLAEEYLGIADLACITILQKEQKILFQKELELFYIEKKTTYEWFLLFADRLSILMTSPEKRHQNRHLINTGFNRYKYFLEGFDERGDPYFLTHDGYKKAMLNLGPDFVVKNQSLAALAQLLPEICILPYPWELSMQDIMLYSMPSDTNSLFLAGFSLHDVDADGGKMTSSIFFIHDIQHLFIICGNLSNERLSLDTYISNANIIAISELLNFGKAVYLGILSALQNIIRDPTESDRYKKMNVFFSFILFHEMNNNLEDKIIGLGQNKALLQLLNKEDLKKRLLDENDFASGFPEDLREVFDSPERLKESFKNYLTHFLNAFYKAAHPNLLGGIIQYIAMRDDLKNKMTSIDWSAKNMLYLLSSNAKHGNEGLQSNIIYEKESGIISSQGAPLMSEKKLTILKSPSNRLWALTAPEDLTQEQLTVRPSIETALHYKNLDMLKAAWPLHAENLDAPDYFLIPRIVQFPAGLRFLLENGWNANTTSINGNTPLIRACRNGAVESAQILIENKVDLECLNKEGFSALHYAAHGGHKEIVRMLLIANKELVDIPCDGDRITPLFLAIIDNHTDTVKILLEAGADANFKKQHRNQAPLIDAVARSNLEIIENLLKHGAEINDSDADGATPLAFAVQSSALKVVEYLLSVGANVNPQDICQQTPLFSASALGHTEIMTVLLNHGADMNITNKEKINCFDIARLRDQGEALSLLLQHSQQRDPSKKKG